jgi:flagellar biosynthesis/type III secretory pathway M-ring protein FliF/YscJ
LKIKTRTEENNNSSKPASEPGTNANTGATLSATVASGETSANTVTEESIESQHYVPTTRETIETPAGATPVTGASVSVPRSHFLKAFRMVNPGDKEPTPELFEPFVQKELNEIRGQVLGCVNQTPPEKVIVRSYYDYLPATATSAPVAASSLPLALTSHAKEIALGALAVVSLFMVMSMVKKGAPAPIAPPAPVERKPSGPIDASEELAGEAGIGPQSMDGMEIADEDVRTNQMIAQVQTMVKEDPEAAASLVKRWLNRA